MWKINSKFYICMFWSYTYLETGLNPIKRSRLEELGRLEGTEEVPKRNNCITLLFSTIITFSSEVWEGDVWEHWERIPWATSDTKLAPSQAYLIDILDGWKLQVYLTSGTMLSVPTLYKRNINCSTSTTRTKIEWTRSPTSIIYCIPMVRSYMITRGGRFHWMCYPCREEHGRMRVPSPQAIPIHPTPRLLGGDRQSANHCLDILSWLEKPLWLLSRLLSKLSTICMNKLATHSLRLKAYIRWYSLNAIQSSASKLMIFTNCEWISLSDGCSVWWDWWEDRSRKQADQDPQSWCTLPRECDTWQQGSEPFAVTNEK